MNENPEDKNAATIEPGLRGRRTAAGVLLFVAGVALARQYLAFDLGQSFLLLLGVAFIVWAALARLPGLLVPGGVLVGVWAGQWLRPQFGDAAFLFSLAGGFLLITLLSLAIFGRRGCWWWPLFPAGGLAFAGLVRIAGSNLREWLQLMQPLWPWVLVAVALYLLFTRPRART